MVSQQLVDILRKTGNILYNNKCKIAGLIAAGINLKLDVVVDPLLFSLGTALDLVCIRGQKNKYLENRIEEAEQINQTLQDRVEAQDANKSTASGEMTMGGHIHIKAPGKAGAVEAAFDVDTSDKEHLDYLINQNLEEETPHIVKLRQLFKNMTEQVKAKGNSVSNLYYNPATRAMIEFEICPIEEGAAAPYRLLIRRKPEAEFRNHLTRLVGANLTDYILSPDFTLEPSEQKAAILFADVRKFNDWVKKHNSFQILGRIGTTLSRADTITTEYGGINKYIGDCLMSFFGPPQNKPDFIYRALEAAYKILDAHNEYIAELESRHDNLPGIGIGIAYGPVAVGFLGFEESEFKSLQNIFVSDSKKRVEYTVMGYTVNVAARLSGAPPNQIYVNIPFYERYVEAVREGIVPDKYTTAFTPVKDPIKVKEHDEPMFIYTAKWKGKTQ